MKRKLKFAVATVLSASMVMGMSLSAFAATNDNVASSSVPTLRVSVNGESGEDFLSGLVTNGTISSQTCTNIISFMNGYASKQDPQKPTPPPTLDDVVSAGVITQADADAVEAAMQKEHEQAISDCFQKYVDAGIVSQSTETAMVTYADNYKPTRDENFVVKTKGPDDSNEPEDSTDSDTTTEEEAGQGYKVMIASGQATTNDGSQVSGPAKPAKGSKPPMPADGQFPDGQEKGMMFFAGPNPEVFDGMLADGIITQTEYDAIMQYNKDNMPAPDHGIDFQNASDTETSK